MIRQYLTLAAILLIGVFIMSEIDWSGPQSRQSVQTSPGQSGSVATRGDTSGRDLGSRDLRSGGISPMRRSSGAANPISPNTSRRTGSAATSSPLSTATSTAFLSGASGSNAVSGMSAGYSSPPDRSLTEFSALSPASSASARRSTPREDTTAAETPENAHPEHQSEITIGGNVLNQRGEPVQGLALTLKLRQARDEDRERFGATQLQARTDAEGGYIFLNLVEGEYSVCTVESMGY